MEIKKYVVKLLYTEHTAVTSNGVVYAHSPEDADFIARRQFLDKRSDKPTIDAVEIKEIPESKDGNAK